MADARSPRHHQYVGQTNKRTNYKEMTIAPLYGGRRLLNNPAIKGQCINHPVTIQFLAAAFMYSCVKELNAECNECAQECELGPRDQVTTRAAGPCDQRQPVAVLRRRPAQCLAWRVRRQRGWLQARRTGRIFHIHRIQSIYFNIVIYFVQAQYHIWY